MSINPTQLQNTINDITSQTNQVRFEQGQKSLGSGAINKEGFMHLLITQLQNQNPLEPVDNTEFISQQAQFAQLEQLDNLNDNMANSFQISQAASWAGKFVEFIPPGETVSETGRVDSVVIGKDGLELSINGQLYPASVVGQIFAESP